MCFVFFLQYLDKQSLSYASVGGLTMLTFRPKLTIAPDRSSASSPTST